MPDIITFRGEELPASYLGDGVYAIHDGYGIWLHANDHREELASDKIYLEPSVLESLINFKEDCEKLAGRKDGE